MEREALRSAASYDDSAFLRLERAAMMGSSRAGADQVKRTFPFPQLEGATSEFSRRASSLSKRASPFPPQREGRATTLPNQRQGTLRLPPRGAARRVPPSSPLSPRGHPRRRQPPAASEKWRGPGVGGQVPWSSSPLSSRHRSRRTPGGKAAARPLPRPRP
uniref:Uncharacterized protein n=1 Tax=Odontella aurita TaxID=265563 RepID=A0A7S4K208_9STRA|mmetsp:Transcript_59797/g.177210  ORF Transcript_59797/g.177210 Transcript_59797/m.177210 type:complete len:161 (+) Transcript_59797:552-1034(+)